MARLRVKMFGTPQVFVDDKRILFPYKKVEALLYYMILQKKESRSSLISLLWDDGKETHSLNNLRHAIFSIRKQLGFDPFLSPSRAEIEWNPDISVECDVWDFTQHGDLRAYNGDFLEDFSPNKAPAFDNWVNDQRASFHSSYFDALLTAEEKALAEGNLSLAEQYGQASILNDPFDETATIRLMEVYCRQNKFRKAISLYQDLSSSLASEFGVSPMKETSAYYYQIIEKWNQSTSSLEDTFDQNVVGKSTALSKIRTLCSTQSIKKQLSHCLLVEGDVGIGKSFLFEYLLEHYDFSDKIVCHSCCYQSEISIPLAPWNTVMLQLLPEIDRNLPKISGNRLHLAASLFPCLLSSAYPTDIETSPVAMTNYHAALESALMVLVTISQTQPLLLVFEDIHWMDNESVHMLSMLLHRFQSENIIVLCSARSILPEETHVFVENAVRDKLLERCFLLPFTRKETEQFVRSYIGHSMPEKDLDRIYDETKGNALLLVQLLGALNEGSDLSAYPRSASQVIQYRLEGLSYDEQQTLNLISVFPDWAPFDILVRLQKKSVLEQMYICDHLKQKSLLKESTQNDVLQFAFAHELIRDELVKHQVSSTQRILHLQVAQILESQQNGALSYEKLIYHFKAGGDLYSAFRYKVLALDAYAGRCYEVMPLPYNESGEPEMRERGILSYCATLEKELEVLRTFQNNPEELNHLECILLRAKCRYYIYQGNYEDGLVYLERMISCCQIAHDPVLESFAHLQFINYGVQVFDTEVMERHLLIGKKLLEHRPDSTEYGVFLRLEGLLYMMQGNCEKARTVLNMALQLFQKIDSSAGGSCSIHIACVYNYIGETYRIEQQFEKAFQSYDQAIYYNRGTGNTPIVAVFYTNYGAAAFEAGETTVAYNLFQYAEEIYQSYHMFSGYPITLSYLALYDAKRYDWSGAAQKLRMAKDICNRIRSPWWTGVMWYFVWKVSFFYRQQNTVCEILEALLPNSEQDLLTSIVNNLKRLPRVFEEKKLLQVEAALNQQI